MSADTREIARAAVPAVGWPVGHHRAGARQNPGPDRDADDAQAPPRRRLPRGVEGHRFLGGRWTAAEGRLSTGGRR